MRHRLVRRLPLLALAAALVPGSIVIGAPAASACTCAAAGPEEAPGLRPDTIFEGRAVESVDHDADDLSDRWRFEATSVERGDVAVGQTIEVWAEVQHREYPNGVVGSSSCGVPVAPIVAGHRYRVSGSLDGGIGRLHAGLCSAGSVEALDDPAPTTTIAERRGRGAAVGPTSSPSGDDAVGLSPWMFAAGGVVAAAGAASAAVRWQTRRAAGSLDALRVNDQEMP